MNRTRSSVCAVVVAFYPDPGLEARLGVILPQVDALIVIDNTPTDARARRICLPELAERNTCLIENAENLGVGAALNQGLEHALRHDCKWLLTLDQDSCCHHDLVETLLNAEATCNPSPVIIGSNYLDPRNGITKVKQNGTSEFIDQITVITSGTLVNTRFANAIDRFRSDYFIDQLDHEFCLRVRANGGRVVISRKVVMEHSVGEPGGTWLPVFGHLPNHSPLRKYYVARNSLVTIARYWRKEPGWCLRRFIRLMLGLIFMGIMESQRISKVHAFICGFADGLSGRMGPCRRIFFQARKSSHLFGVAKRWFQSLTSGKAITFERNKYLFSNKTGIEIGGPSAAFSKSGFFPVYRIAGNVDNSNFSNVTVWDGTIKSGQTFRVDSKKKLGQQYICEATSMQSIPSASYDFVLSSHMLEHCANPLQALSEWKRLLRKDGLLVLLLPDKRFTFDHRRPVTSLEHLVADFKSGKKEDDLTHLEEILKLHDLTRDPEAGDLAFFKARSLRNAQNRCLHHHVFDMPLAVRLVEHAGFDVLGAEEIKPHHILVLAMKSGQDSSLHLS